MRTAFRAAAAALTGAGAWLAYKLVRAMLVPDWALAWLLFTFAVGCFWIAAILIRGSKRPL